MTNRTTKKLDSLDRDLARLIADLSRYDETALSRQPGPGQWSVLQIMQHLMIAETGSVKYLQKKLSHQPQLKKAGIQESLRVWLLRIYTWLPFKFKAPAPVAEDKFEKGASFQDVAAQWQASRLALREFYATVPRAYFDKSIYRHPFAGYLTLDGVLDFFAVHIDRHRRQINRTLKG